MNAKPKDAIERIRNELTACVSPRTGMALYSAQTAILAYLDSIPADAVPVVWPADCTKQTLDGFADSMKANGHIGAANALRALAAIAPQKKKRVVNLWESKHTKPIAFPVGEAPEVGTWRCVARNVELED